MQWKKQHEGFKVGAVGGRCHVVYCWLREALDDDEAAWLIKEAFDELFAKLSMSFPTLSHDALSFATSPAHIPINGLKYWTTIFSFPSTFRALQFEDKYFNYLTIYYYPFHQKIWGKSEKEKFN